MCKEAVTVVYLTILAITDTSERKVPVWLLGIGGVFSLYFGMWERLYVGTGVLDGMWEIFLGMLPGGFLLLMAALTKKAGYADGIVLLQLGCIYGYVIGWAFLCVSLLLLSVTAMILLVLKKVQKDSAIPYIPFLAVTLAGYVIQSV